MRKKRYIERGVDSEKKEKYNEILYRLALEEEFEKRIIFIKENDELVTKGRLIEFCNSYFVE